MTLTPLTGLRVVEFTHFIAGPHAGQRLAELGAEVIKIEPPHGDPSRPDGSVASSLFEAYNRGKRSVSLNLREPQDREVAQRLAAGADIVIHNISAESMRRHGLDAATLRQRNPRLIYGSARGFPSTSSRAGDKGFDGVGQAESGMLWVNGTPESGPIKLPFSPVDVATGNALVQAVLVALLHRANTGEGSEVEVSLFEGAIHAQHAYWSKFLQTGVSPDRIGNLEPSVAPAAEILEVADGYVIMSAYLPAHYEALCRLLGIEELIDDHRFRTSDVRLANQQELHDLIQEALTRTGWTIEQAGEAFDSIHIAHGVVRTYQQVLDNNLLQEAGGLATTLRDDGSTYLSLNPPYRVIGSAQPTTSAAPPALGADNDAIRSELAAGRWDINHEQGVQA